jgi:hypothetical protein
MSIFYENNSVESFKEIPGGHAVAAAGDLP